jgi:branched-chain amino acid transport system permease protein
MSGYAEGLLVILAINVIAAYGAFLPLAAGQLNLGTAGFMAIGAYVAGYLSNELALPLALTILGGMLAAGGVGVLLGYPLLRTRGIYLVLATLAFGELVRSGLLNLEFVGAAAGYPVARHAGYAVVCSVAVAATLVVVWLYQTRLGLGMMAIREDEIAADQFGVDVRTLRATAFSLGAAMAGLAGALYAHHYSYIEAQKFNVVLSVYVAMYVLLGGVQTVFGPLLGALFFTMMPELFRIGNTWRFVIFALVVILTMIWRPEGLIDRALIERLRRWLRAALGAVGIAPSRPV